MVSATTRVVGGKPASDPAGAGEDHGAHAERSPAPALGQGVAADAASDSRDGQGAGTRSPIDAGFKRRNAGARRTAWIIAAIAAVFFVASLVQGHLAGIPNWVPPH